jgi:uncharacterized OB-fold protein
MTSVQRLWRRAHEYLMLRGLKCRRCGRIIYPPKRACPFCGSRDLEEITLPRKGRIVTYTVINVPIEGFPKPTTIAVADLGGAKVMAQVIEGTDNVSEGAEVEVALGKVGKTVEGLEYYMPAFRVLSSKSLDESNSK